LARIKILTYSQNEIGSFYIDLLDNPYTDHLIENCNKNDMWVWQQYTIPFLLPHDPQKIYELWEKCIEKYNNFLYLIGAEDVINPPKKFDGTNKYTNFLHRVFTTYMENCEYGNSKYAFNPIAGNELESLNIYIHELEKYIPNNTINRFLEKNGSVSWLEIQSKTKFVENRFLFSDSHDQEYDDTVNVFNIKHILGKDHLYGYLNEDVPDNFDIRKYQMAYCGFCIDYNEDLRRSWKYSPLKVWSRQKDISHYPVGTISKKDLKYVRELLKRGVKNIVVEVIS